MLTIIAIIRYISNFDIGIDCLIPSIPLILSIFQYRQSFDLFDTVDTFDTVDPFDIIDPFNTIDLFDIVDPFDAVDPYDTIDPFYTIDPFDICDVTTSTPHALHHFYRFSETGQAMEAADSNVRDAYLLQPGDNKDANKWTDDMACPDM